MNKSFWCAHRDTIPDQEGYEVCVSCGAAIYNGPLRERDLWDAADAIWAQGYGGLGIPPSFRHRLEGKADPDSAAEQSGGEGK